MEDIVIRAARDSDRMFIVDSWIRSYYGHSEYAQSIPRKIFFPSHRRLVEKILNEATSIVAVSREDEDVVLAHMVFSFHKNCIHYIYVKESFRGLGLCRKFLDHQGFRDGTFISHLTRKANKIRLKMGFVYNPYLVS